jgi:CubicO group peptidase (beta-lactamase class C family)
MRHAPATATLSLLLTSVAVGQAVGQTPSPLAPAVISRIDSVFAGIDRTTSPGCAVAVYRDGRIAYARGYGMANLEHGIAISPRSVFDIGSTSKQFTAAAIALLAQDGKLSLDDDVRRFVPELPQYQRPVTLRHLLNHTSGVRDYLTLMSLRGENFDGVTTDDDALDLVVRQKATNFEPGAEFLYSNSGYFLLSVVVQRVTGHSLARFARERIFEPLGMTHTHFHDDHTFVTPLRATGYSPRPGGGFRIDMSGFEQTGDGAVYTTVEDLLRWDANFFEPKVGGPRLLDDLHTQGTRNDGRTLPYALGLFVDDYRGARRVRHGGSWAGYRADLLRFPTFHTSVAALCNLGATNPSAYADRVADIVLADRFAPATAAAPATPAASASTMRLPPARLAQLAGRYRNAARGETRVVTAADGTISTSLAPGLSFLVDDSATFHLAAAPVSVTFESDASGKIVRMLERIAGGPPNVFEPFTPVTVSATQLAEYAGSYYAAEVDANFIVAADSGRLTVRFGAAPPRPLTPTVRDAFSAGGGTVLLFSRDAKRRVSGVTVNAGRVRGIGGVRRE